MLADLHDRDGARQLIARAAPNELPRMELVWADQMIYGAMSRRSISRLTHLAA